LNNQFNERVGHRETAQYIADLWGQEYVQQRIEGKNESSRNYETTQGHSVSHSYTERSRVHIQDVLELQTGEFYGQLVDSDFSSFKAQIKAQEPGPVPEIVPVTTATSQAIKQNFIRIQREIESLFIENRTTQTITPQPAAPASVNG
jgi:hypothetical protein